MWRTKKSSHKKIQTQRGEIALTPLCLGKIFMNRNLDLNTLKTSRDSKFIEAAIVEAKKALKLGNMPIGAVIVYKEEIIASGHNDVESRESDLGHAEMNAITSID